ncbi:MAG: glycerophosphodiester phosphodiesterase family protein [Kosmotogaceae bacterium]
MKKILKFNAISSAQLVKLYNLQFKKTEWSVITRVILKSMAIIVLLSISTALSANAEFDVQGHRGCRGLMPENTIAAFTYALKLPVDTIELDTVVTKDGVVVINHEAYLNPQRTRKDGQFILEKILIKDLTYEELKEFDIGRLSEPEVWPEQTQLDGQRVPSLEEVLSLVHEYLRPAVQIGLSRLVCETRATV